MAYSSDFTRSVLSENKKKKKKNSSYVESVLNGTYKSEMPTIKTDIAPTKTTKKEEKKRTWFDTGAFSDGYQFGDVTKSIVGTARNIKDSIATGGAKIGEGALNTALYVAGGIAKSKGDETTSNILKGITAIDKVSIAKGIVNKHNSELYYGGKFDEQKFIEENSLLGDKSSSLVQSGGQLLGTAGLQAVGVPWWLTTGVTSFGGETQQAFKKGATYGEAGFSGLVTSGAEILTEKISGGISFGGKTLDDVWLKPLTENIANKTAQTLTKFGLDVVGEGGEEVLSSIISKIGQKLTYEDDKTVQEMFFSKEAFDEYLESFIGGMVLSGGVNSVRVADSIKNKTNYDTGLTDIEEQKADSLVKEIITEQENNGKKLTNKQKDSIKNNVMNAIKKNRNIETQEPIQEELEAPVQEEVRVEEKTDEQDYKIRNGEATVYHGSPNANIDSLSTKFSGINNSKGSENGVLWFTPDKKVANEYYSYEKIPTDSMFKETLGKKGKVYEAKIKLNKPLDLTNLSMEDAINIANTSEESIYTPEQILELSKAPNGQILKTEINAKELKKLGYDGLIAKHDKTGLKEYGVFDDSQIINDKKEAPDTKAKQLEIIQKNNPMQDDYHTGIRSVDDIKTFDETINDDESFVWGDFNQEDAKKALEKGTVTVYSSKPIEQGAFVSTSQNQARDYAGNGKIYSQEVNLSDVAWINGDEGQYAKVDTQTQATTPTQQEIDNLLDIQKNKSGSEYASAFYDLKRKYGDANLYKALNEEYSRQKNGTQEVAKQVEEVIKPLQETVEKLSKQIADMTPASQEVVEQQRQEDFKHITEDSMPTEVEQTIPDESTYEDIESPVQERDMQEVGNKKVKAYQYEHPEVRPYFQTEADNMLGELDRRIEGERIAIKDQEGYITDWAGISRAIPEDIAYLKDRYGYSYADIEKGLQAIIKDEGAENNAVSKRLEILIDERLTKGYSDFLEGYPIPPNQEYKNLLIESDITDYYSNLSKSLDDADNLTEVVEEVAPNPFELTNEQQARIQELRDDTEKWTNIYNERYDDKKFAQKRIKGTAMQNSAEIRNITQGDWLIPIEGGLTETELANKISKLRSNYIGKPVLVNGQEGTITGNSFGKIGVEFADGTKQYVDKNSITPLKDIDSIIQEQQRLYDQHNIAPEPQKQVVEQSKTEVKEIAPSTEKVAQNENTKQPEIKRETVEEEQVAQILSETPTQENRKQRLWAKFRAGILDKGSVFEDLSIRNKNRELMSKWDYMLTAEARAQSVMINGHKQFDTETKTETQTSKSLNDIRAEVGDKVQEFSEYLYHKHNISRMSLESKAQARMEELQATTLAEYDIEAIEKLSRKRITEKTNEEMAELIETAKEYVRLSETKNKPVFGDSVTTDVSQEIVNEYEMNNPEFMDWAKDVYDYNNANLDQLVQSGVISQETAEQFAEMYPDYVPIGRANKNGNAINVPLDTNRTTINTPIKGAKGGNSDILPLFDTMAKRTLQTYRAVAKNNFGVELKNTLKSNTSNQTTNIDEVLENVDQQEGLLQEGKDGKAPTFTVFENGEKVTYDITEDMYNALKPVSDSSILSTTFKPFNKISNFHRGVLTEYNPVFMLTNGIKDAQDVLLNSQHPAKTYAKFGEAYSQIAKKGYWYQEYMANGGEQNSYFDSQEGTFDTERKGIAKALDTFPLKQISQLNNFIEMAPRLAEYIASREAGRSIETSMLDASRVTTNFKAGGDITKWANRNGATFLNASVQGAMQQVRNIREANANGLKGYANLALKFTMAGVPALLLNGLLWNDDDEYEELSDYVKQNYYVVGKYGDGNFIRIPKGRMVSVIQESFNQMKHLITGDGEADLGQFLEIMGTNIAPNNPIENNVLSPIIGAVTNTTWYGDDLVPTRLQDEPVKEQFDESTDKLSIFLGQNLGISPYKINYVLDQYSGGIGDVFLPMMTQQAESGTDNVGSKLIAPLTNKFTVDSVMKNQNVSDLYSKSEELTSKANSTFATDEDILQNKYLNSIKSEMNVLYKEKREIQNSNLSDSDKYEQVREVQEQINSMAKNAMNNYKNVQKTSNYASIGDKEYYLKNDIWTKVNKEEQEELNSLDMDIKAKSTYFDLKTKISKINDSTAENKKSQIATAVKNTSLTDQQKAYVYGKNYSSDETLGVVLNTGISFNEYLDYASQDFKADKYSNGKTISGSRKIKVYDYINSMNIDYEQKLILAKMEYPAEDRYNYEIIDYLNNDSSIDYDTMESILLELGFKVDANGNINW